MFNRWIAVLLLAVSFGYCCADNSGSARLLMPDKTIVILYENDVHCAIDGYTKLAGLRDAIAASDTAYVGITSSEVILNMLRQSTKNYPQEDGSFPQVAGMKYTINVNTHAITDVQVMNRETSQYEPLQADRKYTIGVCDYYNSGGFYGTLKDVTLVEQFNELINIALAKYIRDTLQGDVSAYRNPKQRIHITSI